MNFIVFLCRSAIQVASRLVPRPKRRGWTDDWLAEVSHGFRYLTSKSVSKAQLWRKLLSFSLGAFVDAADLRRTVFDVREILNHPKFRLAASLTLFGVLVASSHGFRHCRESLTALPVSRPEQLMFVSRSARVAGIETAPGWSDFLAWEQRKTHVPLAGFIFDGAVLRVTPGFFQVLGAVPRLPLCFLGRAVLSFQPLAPGSNYIGVIARVQTSNDAEQLAAELTRIWSPNGSVVKVRALQTRLRQPMTLSAVVFAVAIAIGTLLAGGGKRARFYFFVRTTFLEALLAAGWTELMCGLPVPLSGGETAVNAFLGPALLLLAMGLLLLWSLHDQQRRCPSCGHVLGMPVRVGCVTSLMLDRPGLELLCPRGHGSLFLDTIFIEPSRPAAWTRFDESWSDCFSEGECK